VPTVRAGRKLKLRLFAERLRTLAERYVRELEETPGVDLDKLMQALEVVKMARLAAMGSRRRRRPAEASADSFKTLDAPARAALMEDLRAAGVRVEHAPPAALEDFIASHAAPRAEPVLRQKGRYSKHNREHARLLERE
jgi:hypothetical protein